MSRSWKTLAALTAAAAALLALSTSALASSGDAGPAWHITLGPAAWSGSLRALYPGAAGDTERLPFTVANNGSDVQSLRSVSVSVAAAANGDAETAGGADIAGCRASWFAVSVDPSGGALPASVAPGRSYLGTIDLTMRDSGTDQDACRNAAPAVTVTAL